ncbi:MAG: helix-turn-helix domain-containing protein [Myxococcota bacterium]
MKALKGDNARDRILDAARSAFAAKGFSAATVREIAESAAVAKPMVFYYFNSKDSLFESVVGDAIETVKNAYRAALRARGALDGLVALARAHADLSTYRPDLIRFLARCVVVDSTLCARLRDDQLAAIDEILDRLAIVEIDRSTARQLIRGAFSTYYMDTVAATGPAPTSSCPDSLARALWRALASHTKPEDSL